MASAGKGKPTISIVLPVRNESRHLGQTLDDLLKQDFPADDLEVMIVDGKSDDETTKVAAAYRNSFTSLRILENAKKLSSAARNIGYKAGTGEFIFYIDGHCRIPSSHLLSDMVALFRQHQVDVLCRPQPQTAGPQTFFQQGVALARSSVLGHALDSTIYSNVERQVPASSSGAMYRKEVFDSIGLFDEGFDACEDVEFNTRIDLAGLKAMTSPKLTVEYAARTSLGALFRQLYRYGVGRGRLFLKHPSTLRSGTLLPPGFVLGLIALLPLWLISWKAALAPTALYLIYALIVLFTSLTIARRQRKSLVFILPLIFPTIHIAFGLGFLAGIFRSRR
jgi:cellulose synthase/poly-beta-1,6-N-acetylglucosamine synthase-like glycosyltransferase